MKDKGFTQTMPFSDFFEKELGGKWKYDSKKSWQCDDGRYIEVVKDKITDQYRYLMYEAGKETVVVI